MRGKGNTWCFQWEIVFSFEVLHCNWYLTLVYFWGVLGLTTTSQKFTTCTVNIAIFEIRKFNPAKRMFWRGICNVTFPFYPCLCNERMADPLRSGRWCTDPIRLSKVLKVMVVCNYPCSPAPQRPTWCTHDWWKKSRTTCDAHFMSTKYWFFKNTFRASMSRDGKKTVSLLAISQKNQKEKGPVILASRSAGEWRFEIGVRHGW